MRNNKVKSSLKILNLMKAKVSDRRLTRNDLSRSTNQAPDPVIQILVHVATRSDIYISAGNFVHIDPISTLMVEAGKTASRTTLYWVGFWEYAGLNNVHGKCIRNYLNSLLNTYRITRVVAICNVMSYVHVPLSVFALLIYVGCHNGIGYKLDTVALIGQGPLNKKQTSE